MKNNCKTTIAAGLLFAGLVALSPLSAAARDSEDQLIAKLHAPKASEVTSALAHLEKEYPNSPTALPEIKKLLTDSRIEVRRKSARVLGVWHADLTDAEIKQISDLLKGPDKGAMEDGLKALRGLKAQAAVPDIVALLKNPDKNVMRDACRTLAVLANKDVIPSIEPLLTHPDAAVQKDARDAIYTLKSKG